MSSIRPAARRGRSVVTAAVALMILAGSAAAQERPAPRPDAPLMLTGGFEAANVYVFRGVRQNSTGVALRPFADLTGRLLSNKGPLEGVELGAGFWNSLHSGDTGAGGPIGEAWYEARLSGRLAVSFAGGVSVASSYTSYTSPNGLFTAVKEIGLELAVDAPGLFAASAFKPYALLAFEIDTAPGAGQLDGGRKAGRYLELGVLPEYAVGRLSIALPVKVGLSLGNYYELAGKDHRFGFASAGVSARIPVGGRSRIGRWHLQGTFETHTVGETARVFNGGDRAIVVAGLGLSLRP